MNTQEELQAQLSEANEAYRNGEATMSDEAFDVLLDKVVDEEFKKVVGVRVEINKVDLPKPMGSMEKSKTWKEMSAWYNKHDSALGSVVCTPKFDGLAILIEYGMDGKFIRAMTRGNGEVGQDVTHHFLSNKVAQINSGFKTNTLIVGEAVMAEETFYAKYSDEFKNPRNMVAGMLARKDTHHAIKDLSVMVFDVINDEVVDFNKTKVLRVANDHFNIKLNKTRVPSLTFDELTEESLVQLDTFREEYTEFAIDGMIVDVCDKDIRNELGFVTNSFNPKYAMAYKPAVEDSLTTTVTSITWTTSKTGTVPPVIQVDPIQLDGVTITNVTAYNAKYVIDNGIRVGSTVRIIRSGSVIPKIIEVVSVGLYNMDVPTNCNACDSVLKFNETRVHLVCTDAECPAQNFKKIVSFFTTLEIEYCKDGTIGALIEAGYDTVAKIVNMTVSDFDNIAGFKESRANNIVSAIDAKLVGGVSLEALQHASNLFTGLGSRKLELLNEFNTSESKPSLDTVLGVEGFSDKSASVYLDNFDQFWEFIKDFKVTINGPKEEVVGGGLAGNVFVFTGFRDKGLEALVISAGATMGSSVSAKTTHLVVKDKTATSTKITKAKSLGITIIDQAEASELV
jgi:DNA ligase (NAD+)